MLCYSLYPNISEEKLAESSAANAALSAQLQHLSPQLTALEAAHDDTRTKLQTESQLRRNAELLAEDSEAKCRELETTLACLKEEGDALHEELAFKDSELEKTRFQLQVERERHRQEMEELQSDLSVATSRPNGALPPDPSTDGEQRSLQPDPSTEEPSLEDDYVKRLEEELELVTEQLIDMEQKLTQTQELLQEEQSRAESLSMAAQEESQNSVDQRVLQELKEELEVSKDKEMKLKEKVELITEELST